MKNNRNVYDSKSYIAGMNCKPSLNINVHCTEVKNLEIEVSDVKKNDCESYRVLTIGTVNHFMTEKQAEQLFEILEPKLFEETFEEVEDKYRTERARRKQLEEEVEHLRARLYEVRK